ncbi:hypothetical protein [Halorussus ruber]|uniref:hypothetical protein n=1 Tax=Halorussus ruber TaxID=1126238 RepID=UPI0010927409|nr:hypothetical protein [Halorussus ruber]
MTRPRGRRALLQSGALALCGLAGCLDGLGGTTTQTASERPTATETESPSATPPSSGTEDPSETEQTSETESTAEPHVVEFVPVGVQSSFFYLTSPDSMAVTAAEETQFVFVEVRPRTDSPPPSDFSLAADDRRFWGTLAPGDVAGPHLVYELGSSYRSGEVEPGWVAFEVPNPLDADEIALAYQSRRESLDEEFLAELRTPPADFEVVSFDAPEEVAHDEPFEVSLTVENVGEGEGTFRACLNQSGPVFVPRPAELSVPAGERREQTWSVGDRSSAGTEQIGLRLESPAETRTASVEAVGGTTTGTQARRESPSE